MTTLLAVRGFARNADKAPIPPQVAAKLDPGARAIWRLTRRPIETCNMLASVAGLVREG
jgi:hypothetical protein